MQTCNCLVLIAALTWFEGCSGSPQPMVDTRSEPRPEQAKPTTPAVALPGPLGPARQAAPASLGELLQKHELQLKSYAAFRDALEPYIGARVRWRLRSWGGEESTLGYDTPGGQRQPVKVEEEIGRIRFVAPSFRLEDGLVEVMAAKHPVVTCLTLFPSFADPLFIRSDGRRAPAPGHGVVVTIEATIWGALDEGGGTNLWLHDCSVGTSDQPPEEAVPTATVAIDRLTAAPDVRPLKFQKPAVCKAGKKKKRPKQLQDFDWCAFAAKKSEKWKQPKRHHNCTRAKTRAEKKVCRAADEYELIGVDYADVVPAVPGLEKHKASLCKGPEALLLFRVDPPGLPLSRLVLQARCKSAFPRDPVRAGLNGEFELPEGVEDAIWRVRSGVVEASYPSGGKMCTIVFLPERGRTASYGIGMTEKNCEPNGRSP